MLRFFKAQRRNAPSSEVIETAKAFVLDAVEHETIPDRVEPSTIGGVGVTCSESDVEVIVEFYNNGKAHALFSNDATEEMRTRSVPTEPANYRELLDEIRQHLRAH